MAVTSLKTVPEIQRLPLQVFPDRWSNLDNYREVFQRQPFGRFLLNSALVASVAALSSAVVSSLAGYGFAKFRFPGHAVFFFGIVGILMVPFQSVVVPLYLWINRLGLLDTYPGILAPDLVSVFGVFLMRQAIEVVPSDYVDVARIDGASEFGIFWRVILPAARPLVCNRMADRLTLVMAAFALVGIVFVVTALVAVRRRRVIGTALAMLLGLLSLALAALVGSVSLATRGYQALTHEVVAAKVVTRLTGPQQFTATFTFPDGRRASFGLTGDGRSEEHTSELQSR